MSAAVATLLDAIPETAATCGDCCEFRGDGLDCGPWVGFRTDADCRACSVFEPWAMR